MKVTDKITITKEVVDFLRSHSKDETYLYNNRLLFSKLITKEVYNINHTFIKNERSFTLNNENN